MSDFFNGTGANRNRYLQSTFPGRYSSRDTSEKTPDLLLLDVAPLSLAIETAGPPPSSAHPTKKLEIFSLTPTTGPAYEGERPRTEAINFFRKSELSLLRQLPDPTVSLLSPPKADLPTSDALLSPIVLIFFLVVMQCRILIAFTVSCLTLSVAAAPIADSSILDRTPVSVEIERAPEPEPEPGCRMYSCVWYAPSPFSLYLELTYPHRGPQHRAPTHSSPRSPSLRLTPAVPATLSLTTHSRTLLVQSLYHYFAFL
ncbi:hypothetical protein B0H19DRAFT_1373997 [Mycena capillaripes]|nr:hypothetical protein B0H19DRAFT_1373997 [Mycena capillaripes]